MIRSLSGSELVDARDLQSEMLEYKSNDPMFSKDWLRANQHTAVPVNEFFPGSTSVDTDAQRLLKAITAQNVPEMIVSLMDLSCAWKTSCFGSKLLDTGVIDTASSGVFIISNEAASLSAVFDDILFTGGFLVTDQQGSFGLLHYQPAEHYVVVGQRNYVEQSLGSSVKDAWAEWDESIASWPVSREKSYFEEIGQYYREA